MNLTFELLVSCLGPLLGRLLAGLRFPILSWLNGEGPSKYSEPMSNLR